VVALDERKSACFTKSYDGSKTSGSPELLPWGQRSRWNQTFGVWPDAT